MTSRDDSRTPTLVVLSGLPGVGKTTLARMVAAQTGAIHLRLDTIESALVSGGVIERAGGWEAVPDAGYRVAYAMASDLLLTGHSVIADSVNPLPVTRAAWAAVALSSRIRLVEAEVYCSDPDAHRRRVEQRVSDLDGLVVPTWAQVTSREYEPWDHDVLRVDTADGTEHAAAVLATAVR